MLWEAAQAATQPATATQPPASTQLGTTAPPSGAPPAAAPEAIPARRVPDSPRHQKALAGRFLEGYRDAGGSPALEIHLIRDVIPCESGWQLDPGPGHYGLAQFAKGTWEAARCSPDADWRDPWQQGCAVATWIKTGIDPGSTAGWPTCWHVGR